MKKRLLKQIDFKAIEPLENQQLNVLVGGKDVKTVLIGIIDLIFGDGDGNENCGCSNNCNCSGGGKK